MVTAVHSNGLANRFGVHIGDHVVSLNGVAPRDLIEWHNLVSEFPLEIEILRDGLTVTLAIDSDIVEDARVPFGVDVHSAVFDRVQTCDNHCEFCFIYQLPKGMRRSLYLKDDDYRLSFLYGNFTTLTRFTEADFERVVTQNLSPLFVSVHATDSHTRSEMLRNGRGGVSLRWMRLLIDQGIEVRAQIVLCPGVNDGLVLEHTLASLLEEVPGVSSIAVVPLGLSKHNTESRMRVHTKQEAQSVLATIEKWQQRFLEVVGRHVVHAGDELYLVASLDLPAPGAYGDFEMLEDGIGLARRFIDSFIDPTVGGSLEESRADGFFQSVDANKQDVVDVRNPTNYVRASNPALDTSLRSSSHSVQTTPIHLSATREIARTVGVITGEYGAEIIRPLLDQYFAKQVQVHAIKNHYFGGNTAVAGLLTFEDIVSQVALSQRDHLFLLPDVCLNSGRFLDGATIEDLAKLVNVRVIPSTGQALRQQLDLFFSLSPDTASSPATMGDPHDN